MSTIEKLDTSLAQVITGFDPVDLSGLDKVSLLNRQDTKYVIPFAIFPEILEALQNDYLMLDIKGHRHMTYQSLYYDTPDQKMYLLHHNGKLNRVKIRYRKYVETDTCFFEIKLKNNKSRTIKQRIKVSDIQESPDPDCCALIKSHTPFEPENVQPSIWINFKRLTLAQKDFKERLTFDTGLSFEWNNKEKALSQVVIAEIKQERFTTHSPFVQLMRDRTIVPMRISKYCTGMVLLYDGIKYNRFKPKLRTLNKMQHDIVGY